MAHAIRIYGKKTKVDGHIDRVMDLLYDYGPHTLGQIAEYLQVSIDWAREIMGFMKADGTVSTITKFDYDRINPKVVYWILKEDALAA